MAETLLSILLVTTSAKGSSLVFRWPPFPSSRPRLSRARPDDSFWPSQLDNPWKASHSPDVLLEKKPPKHSCEHDPEYSWQRPVAARDRSMSFSQSSLPSSGRNSPMQDSGFDSAESLSQDGYDHHFGYSAEFLASLLCPKRSMCHQKFELMVDDLAFIGHPVCAEADGGWRFRPEKVKNGGRGRESREPQDEGSPSLEERGVANPDAPSDQSANWKSSWLHTFHFVMVLDLPDPSSSASGNVSKYFDIIYEQIAFTVTAVLFQEQVLANFVERECDILGSLKDSCITKGEPFSSYISQALEASSIAPAMKIIYDSIKSSSMAYITLHNLPLELQLPPYLDTLLHSEGDNESDIIGGSEDDELQTWGQEMSFGWRLPSLAPWKSLLLLDDQDDMDPYMNLRGPQMNTDDRNLAEGLIRFLETASVTLSLADMASLLDWDLESQVYPTVRWLVHHRRAKVVDTVHSGLKTVFTLPPKFEAPLAQLTGDFEKQFPHPSIPPLPRILATISTSMPKQADNHFFASVVKERELIPMYHDVVLWMLKRDMLITLHLRIRIVATREIKLRVRLDREQARARGPGGFMRRGRNKLKQEMKADESDLDALSTETRSGVAWLSMSPKSARQYTRRLPSNDSGRSEMSELIINEDDEEDDDEKVIEDDLLSDIESEGEEDENPGNVTDDDLWPSMINDPGRATALQRHWLSAMSVGKDPLIVKRFEQINQYFDGKKSDDEILFRAEISRKQLREVLHHYEDYLQTFLHPS